jgi:hypothetical protein
MKLGLFIVSWGPIKSHWELVLPRRMSVNLIFGDGLNRIISLKLRIGAVYQRRVRQNSAYASPINGDDP